MPRIPVRYLSVLTVLPLLLFSQAAEAARISFATKECGTPPLLEVEFTIDALGVPAEAEACPDPVDPAFGVPGDLVDDDDGTPLYGTTISSVDFTVLSSEDLDVADFGVGDFYGDDSLGFRFLFEPFDNGGGGTLTILFTDPIVIPCFPGDTTRIACLPLDLLIFVDGLDSNPLPVGTTFVVSAVNRAPEPATLSLLGLALAAGAVRRRRSSKH